MTALPKTPLLPAVLVAALLLAALQTACSDGGGIEREPLRIVAADGSEARLEVEVAETPAQRARGLMGRSELASGAGMLFVIEPPGRGFWMKDTSLELTVAFIAECGEIVDFADLEPLSEEVHNTDRPYAFALELNRGWFERNGIAVGDRVVLPRRLLPAGC
jgi:uncharacterized membrane protein (UPF0127 family)